jgi:uncharacterized phage-associated protein
MKDKDQVINFIKEILKQAKENEFTIGKTQLVKLLYLLEIEYYKLHQKRLTDLEWKFLHYGPYPPGIEKILGSSDIEEEQIELSNSRIFHKYSVVKDSYDEYCKDPTIPRLISRVIKEWGGINLYSLLDYVYFETEPMQNVKRGDKLDFSKIKSWQDTKIRKIKINKKRLNEIRKNIHKHIKKSERPAIKMKFNKELSECLQIWDEGKTKVTIKGNVIITPEEKP